VMLDIPAKSPLWLATTEMLALLELATQQVESANTSLETANARTTLAVTNGLKLMLTPNVSMLSMKLQLMLASWSKRRTRPETLFAHLLNQRLALWIANQETLANLLLASLQQTDMSANTLQTNVTMESHVLLTLATPKPELVFTISFLDVFAKTSFVAKLSLQQASPTKTAKLQSTTQPPKPAKSSQSMEQLTTSALLHHHLANRLANQVTLAKPLSVSLLLMDPLLALELLFLVTMELSVPQILATKLAESAATLSSPTVSALTPPAARLNTSPRTSLKSANKPSTTPKPRLATLFL
jgi:hypothetical protein